MQKVVIELDVCGATFVGVLSWVAGTVWLVLLVATRLLLQVSLAQTNQLPAVHAASAWSSNKNKVDHMLRMVFMDMMAFLGTCIIYSV